MVNIQVQQPGMGKKRHTRTPNFPVLGTMRPFGLYPIMAHPVLPGETLKSFRLKWRTISMPIKHPLAGCWLEVWLCYVKLTDLDRDLGNMFISENYSTDGYLCSTSNDRYFTKAGQIDWVKLCAERVHDAYFLDDSETPREIDGVRQTKINSKSWMQNLMFKPADDPLDTTDIHDAYHEMNQYMMMQQMGMSELTYENYLNQYGVRSIGTAEGDPEILRYAPAWTLPVNTVEPTTGAPSSAWVWSSEIKADKDKRFSEPGFIIALASYRPKMYSSKQRYSFSGNLWGFQDWYPAYNLQDPAAGIRDLLTNDPVFPSGFRTDAGDATLIYDHRDLLSHGEQFVNNFDELPYDSPFYADQRANDADDTAKIRGEYADQTSLNDLFVSTTQTDRVAYYEGIASCTIAGHITDSTPGGR